MAADLFGPDYGPVEDTAAIVEAVVLVEPFSTLSITTYNSVYNRCAKNRTHASAFQ